MATGFPIIFSPRLWTPNVITTELWLDGADRKTITLNGTTVSQWNDKSGNEKNVTQSTAAAQPTFQAIGLNGNSALSFDGNDTLQSTTAGLFSGIGAGSLIVVSKQNSLPAGIAKVIHIGIGGATPTTRAGIAYKFSNTGVGGGGRRLDANSFQSFGVNAFTSNVQINIAVFDYNNAKASLRENGTITVNQQTFQTAGVTSTGGGNVYIGNNHNGTEALTGQIAEVIVINSVDTVQIEKIEGYLAWKWGLQNELPASHPYKTSPPYAP